MGIREFVLQRAEREGIEKGKEIKETEKNLAFVKSLLTQTDFSAQKIAQVADVTVSFVEEVKASFSKS